MKKILSIKKVKDLKGKRVLLRLDLNVPIKGGEVASSFRIKKSLQTIKFLKKAGAKTIIISHIGRNGSSTLQQVAHYMNKYIRVGFVPDLFGSLSDEVRKNMKNGTAIMLENLRRHDGEIENDKKFAKELSKMADIYINDAFAVSHRKNASIIELPKLLPTYTGLLFDEEVKNLSLVLKPPKAFLLVLGGAKIKSKLPLLNKYVDIAQNIFVGGALANTLLKEKGFEIGRSLSDDDTKGIKKLLTNKKIVLPVDVLTKKGLEILTKKINEVEKEDIIVDVGDKSIDNLKEIIKNSRLIVLNGPLGNYEKGFDKASKELLKLMSKSDAKTIVGGGDTTLLVSRLKMEKKFTFVSTAGGAMLEFLAKGTLPGIEAIKKSQEKYMK